MGAEISCKRKDEKTKVALFATLLHLERSRWGFFLATEVNEDEIKKIYVFFLRPAILFFFILYTYTYITRRNTYSELGKRYVIQQVDVFTIRNMYNLYSLARRGGKKSHDPSGVELETSFCFSLNRKLYYVYEKYVRTAGKIVLALDLALSTRVCVIFLSYFPFPYIISYSPSCSRIAIIYVYVAE